MHNFGRGVCLLAFVFTIPNCTSTTSARLIPQHANTEGCTFAVSQTTQSAVYEKIIIVGIVAGTDWDGAVKDEYWVTYPGRARDEFVDAKGNYRAVNVPASKILLRGEVRMVRGVVCRCPE